MKNFLKKLLRIPKAKRPRAEVDASVEPKKQQSAEFVQSPQSLAAKGEGNFGSGTLDPQGLALESPRPAPEVEPAFSAKGPDAEIEAGVEQQETSPKAKPFLNSQGLAFNPEPNKNTHADLCAYCQSKNFVKRGLRKKKMENVQLYLCKDCGRTFTSQNVKGKQYPMRVVLDGISYHNLGFTLEDSCRLVNQKFGVELKASTLGSWNEEFSDLCRYSRLRPFAVKMCKPAETVEVTTMAHRQIYRFRYHRPKLKLILGEQLKNSRFGPLKDYLDAVSAETPHQYFQEGIRISEIKTKFDKAQMIIRSKKNYANELASFVLQSVRDNKQRHEELQRFMIANDSVTVATEVPVYIRKEDIEHMENQLSFKIIDEEGLIVKGDKPNPQGQTLKKAKPLDPQGLALGSSRSDLGNSAEKQFPRLLTGHVDILQVRNGQVHILDYKPNAAKEKPVEQLTWYALALSRLTGLRLYEFKCAWFDEKDYFEFYPLHVVYKLKGRKRGKVRFKSGIAVEIPTENTIRVV